MDITIRPVRPEDLDRVARLEAACFPPAEAAGKEEFARRIAAFPECFLVAESAQGEIIGMINGCVTDTTTLPDELYHDATLHQPDGPYQTVFGLDVLPEWRRQGIAARLMEAFLDQARQRGKTGAILTCKDHLLHYYERFGYRCQGRSASTHGGAQWNDMLLLFADERR